MSKPKPRSDSKGGSRKNEDFAGDRDEVTFIFFLKLIDSASKKKIEQTSVRSKHQLINVFDHFHFPPLTAA